MGKDYSICVGAVGFGGGVWHSPDAGETWNRIRDPFPLGSQVRGLAVYPDDPNRILAGSPDGLRFIATDAAPLNRTGPDRIPACQQSCSKIPISQD